MNITIIIPTYNEAAQIERLIHHLRQYTQAQILVANSPSTTDNTAGLALTTGAEILNCPRAGRAPQMNYAAEQTTADILYFVHADTLPPASFMADIEQALKRGNDLGYFSYQFESEKLLLKFNSFFTRYDGLFAGGGDQTLFIRRTAFEQLGGFHDELRLMEDFDLVKRARRAGLKHCLIPKNALVSARKYDNNSWMRVNLVNLWVFLLFHCGVSSDRLCQTYRKLLQTD
ncbi:MAG: TIGR04283 family arsenosugar biosynthesis glycosyltransferase [Lewinella sp.]|uniref:TIGR04283 family arsenosugar biosynthesis glycosyltransferase n=1 Tax=Lewinella sp. TaxID=2004506 RepID=UPI003D6A926F